MPVRNFNSDNSEIRIPVAAGPVLGSAFTIAVLIKPNAKDDWESIVAGHDSSGSDQWQFGSNPSNEPIFYVANGSQLNAADGAGLVPGAWQVAAVARDGDDFEFSVGEFGEAFVHAPGDLGGSKNTPTSTSGGYLCVGAAGGADDLSARVALLAVWSSFLSQAQREALRANLATADWTGHQVQPVGVWEFAQASVSDPIPDLMGVHATVSGTITGATDNNGVSGTSVVTDDDPPGWTFGVGSDDAPRGFMMTSEGLEPCVVRGSAGALVSRVMTGGGLFPPVS